MYNWLHILIRPVAQVKRENKKLNLHNIWNTSSVDAIDKMIQTPPTTLSLLKTTKTKTHQGDWWGRSVGWKLHSNGGKGGGGK